MTTTTLFGIFLAPLYAAIAQVESDRGATSANIYQIDEDGHGYTDDVNKILEKHCLRFGLVYRPFPMQAKLHKDSAERMMLIYWKHWGEHYEKSARKPVTMEVLARIHNGGPLGWKKQATLAYWKRVESALKNLTREEVEAWANGGTK